MSIRRLCQELIYKHSRTAFKCLHSDVEVRYFVNLIHDLSDELLPQRKMRAKPELHGMENIFGQLVREGKWTSEAKRIASNVRNTFRQEVSQTLQPLLNHVTHYAAHWHSVDSR